MAQKQKVVLEIRKNSLCAEGRATYLVLSTVNCLAPEAGSVLSNDEASRLIRDGVDVVVKNPRRV